MCSCIKTGVRVKVVQWERKGNKQRWNRETWMGKGSEGETSWAFKALKEQRWSQKDKGRWEEASLHPQLICPVAAQPEDRDALMSKNTLCVCVCFFYVRDTQHISSFINLAGCHMWHQHIMYSSTSVIGLLECHVTPVLLSIYTDLPPLSPAVPRRIVILSWHIMM